MEKKKTLTSAQIADAERLKALYEAKKKELGITQQSIADMLDISQGGVGHYLNGRNALNAAVAAVLPERSRWMSLILAPALRKKYLQ